MTWKREVAAAGLLLGFGICSILTLSQVLDANGVQLPLRPNPAPSDEGAPGAGEGDVSGVGRASERALYPPPEPLLDLKEFRYLLNADPCGADNVTGVVLVTSHADHVELRSAVRRAYPLTELRRLGLRRVFLLARAAHPAEDGDWQQRALDDEARRFHDLVQGDFKEAYRNLTYKHTMGLRWAVRHCSQARYVIKMDDDIVVDFYQLVDRLKKQPAAEAEDALQGYVLRGLHPSREPRNKWFVTADEYPGDTYPDFLSGWLYVTTPAVARRLVSRVHRRRYFWIDDLVLTGLVRADMDPADHPPPPALRDLSALFTTHPEVLDCCVAEPDLRCDVLVGPNGGENELIMRFQEHAARCHYGHMCRDRPSHRKVERSCVVRGGGGRGSNNVGGDALAGGRGVARPVRLF